ncbi:MAG: Tad domain-containing protein [Pseudomonadota bacterium]
MRAIQNSSLNRFARHEGGGILLFVLVLFLLMALAIGMAVDFMRHEMARADLQNALDRGTLAAASLTQKAATQVDLDEDGTWDTLTDEQIEANYKSLVADYMKSRSVFPATLELEVDWEEVGNEKTIRADASYSLPTSFLMLAGKSQLMVEAESFASQTYNDVEISLVFDVSGSMYDNNVTVDGVERTRMAQAQIDAQNFVTDVFTRDALGDQVSVSLVPYSSKVTIPSGMAAAYNIKPAAGATTVYTDQYCVNFVPSDFTTRSITTTEELKQYPLFDVTNSGVDSCPQTNNAVVPLSRNKDTINAAIQGITRENWTAVYEGVKWGTALLDPVTRDAQPTMQLNGTVTADAANLPQDYDPTVVKVLVVMSDGRNTQTPTLLEDQYTKQSDGTAVEGEPHDYWRDRRPSRYNDEEGSTCGGRGTGTGEVFLYSNSCRVNASSGGSDFGVNLDDLSDSTLTVYEDGSRVNEPDALLYEICDRAKEVGIVIYTIAFEITAGSSGARALKECATSDDKAYEVGGYNLDEAFDAIVADISNLKLSAAPDVDEGGGDVDVGDGDGDEVVVDLSDPVTDVVSPE